MGVYRRGNRWYIGYSVPGGFWKRETVTIEGKRPEDITRNEALTCLAIRRASIGEGKFNILDTSRSISFDRLCEVFLNDYSRINKRSWKRDRTSIKALTKHFGGKRINTITPWTVDKYKAERLKTMSYRKRPVTKASVNRELSCLKKMLSYAVGARWLPANPLSGYQLFPERPNKIRVVSPEEFRRVYKLAPPHLQTIILTAYLTGMRYSEILALQWENVDLDKRALLVSDSKNGLPRYIPINDELGETLIRLQAGSEGEHVFTFKGKPVKYIQTAFNRAVLDSGVERFTFHDLRHTFASNLIMAGVDIATAQEILGHKTIAMTKRYAHPTLQHKKEAVRKLGSVIIDTLIDTPVISLENRTRKK